MWIERNCNAGAPRSTRLGAWEDRNASQRECSLWPRNFSCRTAVEMPPALTPALSPEEREKRSTSSGKSGCSSHAPSLPPARGQPLNSKEASRFAETRRTILPLPGGEGRGEGGRTSCSHTIHTKLLLRDFDKSRKLGGAASKHQPRRSGHAPSRLEGGATGASASQNNFTTTA